MKVYARRTVRVSGRFKKRVSRPYALEPKVFRGGAGGEAFPPCGGSDCGRTDP